MNWRTRTVKLLAIGLLLFSYSSFLTAQTMPDALRDKVDALARKTLAQTGVPSASIAIVQGGAITHLQAYGDGSIEPRKPAAPTMRYSIGSISKQFTAAAILLLAEDGKLSLDDPVSRFVPNLTRGNEVTIRELLSHTSGYQDYWPQDYVMPSMLQPVTADKILDQWARKPLDFEPGTDWQYSNTNFVIAGLIVEKASGKPILQFLSQRIFTPLGMKSVMNIDQERLTETDATGYLRYAIGPLRPAPKEGEGWLFAAGELAMPAEDLAKWDISIINQSLLKPASYAEMERETVLKNGLGTHYGLGVGVRNELASGRSSMAARSPASRHKIWFSQIHAQRWSCLRTKMQFRLPETWPGKLRRCSSATPMPPSRKSRRRRSLRACSTERSIGRC